MMQQQIKLTNIIKLSGAYIAYLIGSGFATGQEVMQFLLPLAYMVYSEL